MKELILLRGLPGAGKTTLSGILAGKDDAVLSVDDHFTDPVTGEYEFDYSQNHLAYKACEEKTREAMQKNKPRIFVHNTFTMDWELQPYFKLASDFDYRLHVITVENYHQNENAHGVSREQLDKMAAKYRVKLK